jgi:acetoin utilization protein AcuB
MVRTTSACCHIVSLATILLHRPVMSASSPQIKPANPPIKRLVLKYWMTPSLHSIGKDQPLAVAHRLMKEQRIRHLPVLDGGKLVGLISERDLYFLETIAGVDVEKEPVEEGMTRDIYCVSPDAPLREVVLEMAHRKYGCALAVEGTKAVGIFTTTDALHLLAAYLEFA